MSARKYELTGEVRDGLHRIRRIADGVLGGWIEAERNLSHEGDAWVSGDARVYGAARVYGDARVYGAAWVYGTAQVSRTLKISTRSDGYTFALFPCADGVWRVTAGCRFFTMDEAWRHWGHGARANTALGEESEIILTMFEQHIEHEAKWGIKA